MLIIILIIYQLVNIINFGDINDDVYWKYLCLSLCLVSFLRCFIIVWLTLAISHSLTNSLSRSLACLRTSLLLAKGAQKHIHARIDAHAHMNICCWDREKEKDEQAQILSKQHRLGAKNLLLWRCPCTIYC